MNRCVNASLEHMISVPDFVSVLYLWGKCLAVHVVFLETNINLGMI